MAKFFKRNQLKSRSGNRLTKYLLFARGALILLVIGILTALQINTSKEERQSASWSLHGMASSKRQVPISILPSATTSMVTMKDLKKSYHEVGITQGSLNFMKFRKC